MERTVLDTSTLGAPDSDSLGHDCYLSEKGIQALPEPVQEAAERNNYGRYFISFIVMNKNYYAFENAVIGEDGAKADISFFDKFGNSITYDSITIRSIFNAATAVSYMTLTNNEFMASMRRWHISNNLVTILNSGAFIFMNKVNGIDNLACLINPLFSSLSDSAAILTQPVNVYYAAYTVYGFLDSCRQVVFYPGLNWDKLPQIAAFDPNNNRFQMVAEEVLIIANSKGEINFAARTNNQPYWGVESYNYFPQDNHPVIEYIASFDYKIGISEKILNSEYYKKNKENAINFGMDSSNWFLNLVFNGSMVSAGKSEKLSKGVEITVGASFERIVSEIRNMNKTEMLFASGKEFLYKRYKNFNGFTSSTIANTYRSIRSLFWGWLDRTHPQFKNTDVIVLSNEGISIELNRNDYNYDPNSSTQEQLFIAANKVLEDFFNRALLKNPIRFSIMFWGWNKNFASGIPFKQFFSTDGLSIRGLNVPAPVHVDLQGSTIVSIEHTQTFNIDLLVKSFQDIETVANNMLNLKGITSVISQGSEYRSEIYKTHGLSLMRSERIYRSVNSEKGQIEWLGGFGASVNTPNEWPIGTQYFQYASADAMARFTGTYESEMRRTENAREAALVAIFREIFNEALACRYGSGYSNVPSKWSVSSESNSDIRMIGYPYNFIECTVNMAKVPGTSVTTSITGDMPFNVLNRLFFKNVELTQVFRVSTQNSESNFMIMDSEKTDITKEGWQYTPTKIKSNEPLSYDFLNFNHFNNQIMSMALSWELFNSLYAISDIDGISTMSLSELCFGAMSANGELEVRTIPDPNFVYFTGVGTFEITNPAIDFISPTNIADNVVGIYGRQRDVYIIKQKSIEHWQIADTFESPLNWVKLESRFDDLIAWGAHSGKFNILVKDNSDYYANGKNYVNKGLFRDGMIWLPAMVVKGQWHDILEAQNEEGSTDYLLLISKDGNVFKTSPDKFIFPITQSAISNVYATLNGDVSICDTEPDSPYFVEFFYRNPKNLAINSMTIATDQYDESIHKARRSFSVWKNKNIEEAKTSRPNWSRQTVQNLVKFYKLGRGEMPRFIVKLQGYLKGIAIDDSAMKQKF